MKAKKHISLFLCAVLFFLMLCPTALPAGAAAGPSLTTTLSDGQLQRGSKKTFDVWARNAAGEKIKATVKLNGQKLSPTWDDSEKASYTLVFTKEGDNTVTVSASSDGGRRKTLTYHITYKKAQAGEAIGAAVWSVELFTIGCGYLIPPTALPIYEGETAAEQLVRLLHENGYVGYYGGTVKSSFYLAYIADGTAESAKYNGYQKSGTPAHPQRLNLTPRIPALLLPHLRDTMTFFDPEDYQKNWAGYLGEFAFTNGSGWMYTVNHIFPNVGFADTYLSDGDVVRVQFTLGYGADIGGFGAMGTEIPDVDTQPEAGYFTVADKDALSRAICRMLTSPYKDRANVRAAYREALAAMSALDAGQSRVNAAAAALTAALNHPDSTAVSSTSAGGGSSARRTTSPAGSPDKVTDAPSAVSEDSGKTAATTSGSAAAPADEPQGRGTQTAGGSRTEPAPSADSPAGEEDTSGGQSGGFPAAAVVIPAALLIPAAALAAMLIRRRAGKHN